MNQETKILLGIGLLTLSIFVGAIVFLSGSKNTQAVLSASDQALVIRKNSTKITVPNSKVTIVEFADFQCPFCAKEEQAIKQVLKDYNGKITVVFRHLPLPQHRNSMKAALAAESAGKQNNFLGMYEKLYEHQDEWSEADDPMPIYSKYAEELQLNIPDFVNGFNDKTLFEKIQTDMQDAQNLGITSTPTLFINGQKLSGYVNYEELKNIVKQQM